MQKNSWIGKQTEPINRLVNKWQQHKTKQEMKPKIKTTTTQNQTWIKTKQSKAKQSKIKTESKCGIV